MTGTKLRETSGHADFQRLLGVTVIAFRVYTIGHVIADHSILHALLIGGVEILEDDIANCTDGCPAALRQ